MESLPLDAVDIDDRTFKISRNWIGEALYRSVRECGVLDRPLLLERDGMLAPIFGHNRLAVLRTLGARNVNAKTVSALDREEYLRMALLKCARGEVGPAGKVRVSQIMRSHFGDSQEEILRLAKKGLAMPADFAADGTVGAFLSLPDGLRDYCDARDISFRTIAMLLELPGEARAFIASFCAPPGMKVNSFRAMVEMLIVIVCRDGGADYTALAPCGIEGPEAHAAALEALRALRNPRYTEMKKKADAIVAKYAALGIGVEYPPYFDGRSLAVRLDLARGDDPALLKERLGRVPVDGLEELLKLL